jgi:predicted secreted protein
MSDSLQPRDPEATMGWVMGTSLFFLIWWTVLFAVLPIGTRPVEGADPEAGGWRGAPVRPLMGRKIIGTTVLTVLVWIGIYAVVESGWVDFREGWWAYQGPGISGPMPGRAQN